VNILVVDDSPVMRKIISRELGKIEGEEVEIVEASDGMEALAVIQQHGTSLDLIFCDMNMPKWNGLTLLRSLRSSPELKHIPFIIVTADETSSSVEQALREGAAGVVGKPFPPGVIASIVRRRRSHGRRATSAMFRTDAIARSIRAIVGSSRRNEESAS
jgi:CheY-like chemotaxis protein